MFLKQILPYSIVIYKKKKKSFKLHFHKKTNFITSVKLQYEEIHFLLHHTLQKVLLKLMAVIFMRKKGLRIQNYSCIKGTGTREK